MIIYMFVYGCYYSCLDRCSYIWLNLNKGVSLTRNRCYLADQTLFLISKYYYNNIMNKTLFMVLNVIFSSFKHCTFLYVYTISACAPAMYLVMLFTYWSYVLVPGWLPSSHNITVRNQVVNPNDPILEI